MNELTPQQKLCLARMGTWPKWRNMYVKSGRKWLEYDNIKITQIKKKKDNIFYKTYDVTMDGVPVPVNLNIDVKCRTIFRRYLKLCAFNREDIENVLLWMLAIGYISLWVYACVLDAQYRRDHKQAEQTLLPGQTENKYAARCPTHTR